MSVPHQNGPNPPIVEGWNPCWEENVYGEGRHLNRYPYHAVVGFVFRHFGHVSDRSLVRILELGCGAGNNLWFAAREGFTVAGIDGSPSAIEFAKKRFAQENLTGDLRVGDFTRLPWPEKSFDLVIDRGALTCSHRAAIEAALDETRRVLKRDGKFLSTIYSTAHPDREFGRDLGDNTYDEFTAGYFAGLGTAHFVPHEEIDQLYASRFKVLSACHTCEAECLNPKRVVNAFWKIECAQAA